MNGTDGYQRLCASSDSKEIGEEGSTELRAYVNKKMNDGESIANKGSRKSSKRKRSPSSSRNSPKAHIDSGSQVDDSQANDSPEATLVSERLAKQRGTTKNPPGVNYRQDQHRFTHTLPPILLNGDREISSCVSHLPKDSKVDIFNRRTGKIMCGDQAVAVGDLADVLKNHAEYEPIIPSAPSSHAASKMRTSFREGRSSANTRISSDVTPQARRKNSAFDGRSVVVTNGPYKGLIGSIQGSVSGGWYLVAGIFRDNDADLPLAISPENLELIPETDDNAVDTSSQATDG